MALLVPLLAGCGRGEPHSPEAVERGRLALEAALESWKKGEPVGRLKVLPEPVEFADDARAGGQRLLDYRLLRTDPADRAVIRYTVALTLQDRRGRRAEREVTYSVALKSPIVIACDPYF
jgi:hypothetical protein